MTDQIAALEAQIEQMREALEMARNGIQWYIENSPEANGCDDEAIETIDAALATPSPTAALDQVKAGYEETLSTLRAKVKWLEGEHSSIVGWPWDAPFNDGYEQAKDEFRKQIADTEAGYEAVIHELRGIIEYCEGHITELNGRDQITDALFAEYEEAEGESPHAAFDRVKAGYEAIIKVKDDALESCTEGDYSTGHVIHPSFDEALVSSALSLTSPTSALDRVVAEIGKNMGDPACVNDALPWMWDKSDFEYGATDAGRESEKDAEIHRLRAEINFATNLVKGSQHTADKLDKQLSAANAEIDRLKESLSINESIVLNSCRSLAYINEALGCDPDGGGHVPIIEKIAELRAELDLRTGMNADVASVGKFLTNLLDEDQWATAERMLFGINTTLAERDAEIAAAKSTIVKQADRLLEHRVTIENLEAEIARLKSDDPPIPVDIHFGNGKVGKGCKLSIVQLRINAMAEARKLESAALRAAQLTAGNQTKFDQQPVAECYDNGTPEGGIRWLTYSAIPTPIEVGTKFYVAPPTVRNEESSEYAEIFTILNEYEQALSVGLFPIAHWRHRARKTIQKKG